RLRHRPPCRGLLRRTHRRQARDEPRASSHPVPARRRGLGPHRDHVVVMRLENSFEVAAPPPFAWRLLNDVPNVLPCMPGAELEEVLSEDSWKAKLHVRLGPIALQFIADVTREEVDEAAGRVVLVTKAREAKGRGGADARIESVLSASG